MLLPVTAPSEPGGSAGISSRHLAELIVAAVPAGMTGTPDRRLHDKRESEGAGPAVDIAPTAAAGSPELSQALSLRMARWEPVARALGHASQAIAGFLKSVGVPQAQAEDIARRAAESARERLAIEQQATQAHFEAGRLSLKLEDVHVGFRRGGDKAEVRIGKAAIGVDVEIPGARREETGVTVGHAEAEIGQRKVAFEYKGPGATTPYADRGAAGVNVTVAAPISAPPLAGISGSGPVDVAI